MYISYIKLIKHIPKQNAASLAQFNVHATINLISIGVTLNKN